MKKKFFALLKETFLLTILCFLIYLGFGKKLILFTSRVLDLAANDMIPDKEMLIYTTEDQVCCVHLPDTASRHDIIQVVEKVLSADAAVIGLDINFEERKDSLIDRKLEELLLCYQQQIVLPYTYDEENQVKHFSFFMQNEKDYPNVGYSYPINIGGRDWIVDLEDMGDNAFVYLLVKQYRQVQIHENDLHSFFIDYNLNPLDISGITNLDNRKDELKGKIVIVGIRDPADYHLTPSGMMYGYLMHGYAVNTLLSYHYSWMNRYLFPFFLLFFIVLGLLLTRWACIHFLVMKYLSDLCYFIMNFIFIYLLLELYSYIDYNTLLYWIVSLVIVDMLFMIYIPTINLLAHLQPNFKKPKNSIVYER